jgi:hypothetical protein
MLESEKIITEAWLNSLKLDLMEVYKRKNLKASGKFETLSYVEMNDKGGAIMSPRYAGAMIFGRRPNFNQDPDAMRKWVMGMGATVFTKWVADKGLSLNPFAVAWSKARKGTIVPNTYNDGRLIEEALTNEKMRELTKALAVNILKPIKEQWQSSR